MCTPRSSPRWRLQTRAKECEYGALPYGRRWRGEASRLASEGEAYPRGEHSLEIQRVDVNIQNVCEEFPHDVTKILLTTFTQEDLLHHFLTWVLDIGHLLIIGPEHRRQRRPNSVSSISRPGRYHGTHDERWSCS